MYKCIICYRFHCNLIHSVCLTINRTWTFLFLLKITGRLCVLDDFVHEISNGLSSNSFFLLNILSIKIWTDVQYWVMDTACPAATGHDFLESRPLGKEVDFSQILRSVYRAVARTDWFFNDQRLINLKSPLRSSWVVRIIISSYRRVTCDPTDDVNYVRIKEPPTPTHHLLHVGHCLIICLISPRSTEEEVQLVPAARRSRRRSRINVNAVPHFSSHFQNRQKNNFVFYKIFSFFTA